MSLRVGKMLRSRRKTAEQSHQRLDIQGLRMVAVLLVFADHLCGWPRGGFIGVDVFFVISGFLITGNLLRMAENTGNVSFKKFYWNRIRRIVPAATLVLVLTFAASLMVFQPFRAHQVGLDAFYAFVFMSNWWFAVRDTNYFSAGDAVSPIQHFWSLSIEEQFYFLWPALIFVIGVLVASRAWTHSHRMRLAGAVMMGIVAASLGWAIYQTATAPTWAYFDTFSRVWELGVGALLATAVGTLAGIPALLKPYLSWAGLGMIAAGALLIDGSAGFPAPWALLPVAGSAMVLAAGVGGEPEHQAFLSNRASVYVGNISYSLYLVHWPVIVILGALMSHRGATFFLAVITVSFGLAIASYHFIENPLRYIDGATVRRALHQIRKRRIEPERSTIYAGVAVLCLITVGLTAYTIRPYVPAAVLPETAATGALGQKQPTSKQALGPLGLALQQQIQEALKATSWPLLDPSMDSVLSNNVIAPEIGSCDPAEKVCSWGSPDAPTRVILVGDSVAMTYANPLRELALNSGGKIQITNQTMGGCKFLGVQLKGSDASAAIEESCPGFVQRSIDLINTLKPDVVIISNIYNNSHTLTNGHVMAPGEWAEAMRQTIDKFEASVKRVVWLSPNPRGKNPQECFGTRASVPADCISQVNDQWSSQANEEQSLAESSQRLWIDSRLWFCNEDGLCPAFVGSTPARRDESHMTAPYLSKIYPVIGESLTAAGVFGAPAPPPPGQPGPAPSLPVAGEGTGAPPTPDVPASPSPPS